MAVYVNGELVLYGFVGESLWREGFTSSEVLQALAEHGTDNDLTVLLNSGGGYAFEGIAIYNALKAHKGTVTVKIDAIAASAASVIALAGDSIVMRAGSELMIHDPSGSTYGTASDHDKTSAALNKLAEQMSSLYSARSGKDLAEVRQIMKDETWFTAEEAVEAGFADEAEEAKAKQATAFDYRVYANAPERLVALSVEKGWTFEREINRIAASAAPTSQEETSMAETTEAGGKSVDVAKVTADATAAAQTRIKAILGSDEAKGREAQAQHLAFSTDMTAEDAVAILAAGVAAQPTSEAEEEANPAAYEAERLRASGQALPSDSPKPAQAKLNRAGIFASRAQQMKGA